ncbi:SGNH/GDSL hydrolase family protein [Silvibacterium acidisoli]|uniref:SGNH/GDSL hydrolase family protein n=1 Tax=Acidobacteriaceae bacterium ZG23-2 TaxID=2883246 RepID=UPI00406C0F79
MPFKHSLFLAIAVSLGAPFLQAQSIPAPLPQPPAATEQPAPPTPAQIERMRKQLADWPDLARYRDEDAALPVPPSGEQRVVFMGDSITDRWGRKVGTFFPGKPYINRGISGQTTPQMLIRFQQDVVKLHPAVVVVLAGTNDIARNTGPSSPAMIEDNVASMVAIARQNHIRVVLSSILPAAHYHWRPDVNGTADILEVNGWLKNFCMQNGLIYLDYYSAMADSVGAMKPGLSSDEVHPTEDGYRIMSTLAESAIEQALRQ